jgi:hypothetical protein
VLSAVEILIARTKTHPEEFSDGQLNKLSKWGDLINNFTNCMTKEEREALAAAMTEAKRTLFNEAVMKRLVGTDAMSDIDEAMAAKTNINTALRPKGKSILTMSQITADSLKILEQQLTMDGIKYVKEYDVDTDSYTLMQGMK